MGVTTRGELLSEHVVRVLNSQLHHHPLEAVAQSLSQISGPQKTIEQVYELVTQHGSIEQLHRLAEIVSERCVTANGPALYSPGDASLGAAVRYLGVNKSILPVDWKIRSSARIESESVVILDEMVLTRMRSDPIFMRAIIESKATLLTPLGFLHGVTPFRTPTLGDIEARVESVLKQAEIHPADSPGEVERKVIEVMRFEVLSLLNRIDPRLCDRVEFVAARLAAGESAVERITRQLNGQAGISVDSLESILDRIDPRYRPVVKDLLVQHTHVHSHISLGRAAREHGSVIARIAAEQGVDSEDVAFHCPKPNKSFSMYGMIFRERNPDFPTASFTTPANLGQWLEARADRPRLVVILDDFAGSGDSFRRAVESTRDVAPGLAARELVISPLIATKVSMQRLRDSGITAECILAPVRVESRILDGAAYGAATPEIQLAQRAALGLLGFAEMGTMVALPYMSPDNNADVFAQCFAEYFTLSTGAVWNHHGGVQEYAPKLHGQPSDVLYAQVEDKMTNARQAAGLLPTLKSLLEHEQGTRMYWDHLPESVRVALGAEWERTESAFRAERVVAIYSQLISIRDGLSLPALTPEQQVQFALDFRELDALTNTIEIPADVRKAIDEFRDEPVLRRFLDSIRR